MESFVHTLLSNALAATVLAVVATCLARACRRPAVTHSLWLLVMIKLITPPLVPIALPDAGIAMPARSDVAIANDVRDFGTEAQADVLSTFRDTHDSEPPHADTGPAEDLAMLAKTEK
jgi:hypothetical protein